MSGTKMLRALAWTALLGALLAGAWCLLGDRDSWPRGEALGVALRPFTEGEDAERALVARAIWDNYLETRANAARWSGVYWGFTFAAAVCSALAAVVLKLETLLGNEALKKDCAALLSVAAALLVTLSTSGDFQRKWQANRIAAAEIERTGYDFLAQGGADARSRLAAVSQSLFRRHLAIAGGAAQGEPPVEAGKPAAAGK